jgi:hypothetical protein
MHNRSFDAFTRAIDRRGSRRTTLSGLTAGALAALMGRVGFEADARRRCKRGKVRCGDKCCGTGLICTKGKCVPCAAGEVFCENDSGERSCDAGVCCSEGCSGSTCCPEPRICDKGQCVPCAAGEVFCERGNLGRGCYAGVCCSEGCSGSTCCPEPRHCGVAQDHTNQCFCPAMECDGVCCGPAELCSGRTCSPCTVGTTDICVDGAPRCGFDGFCAKSFDGNTACVKNVFECGDCEHDGDCTAVLGRPGLCVYFGECATDCVPGPYCVALVQ